MERPPYAPPRGCGAAGGLEWGAGRSPPRDGAKVFEALAEAGTQAPRARGRRRSERRPHGRV